MLVISFHQDESLALGPRHMKKFLKISLWLAAALAALVIAAVIIIPLFVDPNAYRGQIGALVKRETGRTLTIDGRLELSVFPWLGLQVGKSTLSNAPGFGPEPFARIDQADVKVKLLPLLSRRVEMDKVVLRGLVLHLARNAKGQTNWQDLAGTAATKTEEPPPKKTGEPGPALGALALGGLDVSGAKVVWDDRVTGQHVTVENIGLNSGALAPNAPIPLHLTFDVASRKPRIQGHLALDARVTVDPKAQTLRAKNTVLETRLKGPDIPGGEAAAKLETDIQADLAKQTAEVERLRLSAAGVELDASAKAQRILGDPASQGELAIKVSDGTKLFGALPGGAPQGLKPDGLDGTRLHFGYAVDLSRQSAELSGLDLNTLGMHLTGKMQAQKIVDAPSLAGHLESPEFSPRSALQTLGVALPKMADGDALDKAAFAFDFTASPREAAVKRLKLRVDQTTLQGSAGVRNFAAPVIRYDLAADRLDLDRYLPPPAPGKPKAAATPAGAAAAGAGQIPLDELRRLDVKGTLRIGKLKAGGLRVADLRTTLNGRKGLFRMHPASAKLYGGNYAGDMRFDARRQAPVVAVNESLSGVQAGPLLKDLVGKEYVTGTADVSAKLTGRGLEPMQLRRSLSGTAGFQFRDGAVNGINIAQLIRKAYATIKGQPAPPDEPEKTDFAELSGTLNVNKGLVRNDDLLAKSPLLRINGAGQANLVNESVDYRAKAAVVGTLKGQGGKELGELKRVSVPIHVTGTLRDPKFGVDLGSVLDAKAKEAVEREKKKLQEKLDEKLKGNEDKLRRQLQDGLKNLFQR